MTLFKTKAEKRAEKEERLDGRLYSGIHNAILLRDYPVVASEVYKKTHLFITKHSLEEKIKVVEMILCGKLNNSSLLELFEEAKWTTKRI